MVSVDACTVAVRVKPNGTAKASPRTLIIIRIKPDLRVIFRDWIRKPVSILSTDYGR
jgi:hypothetical protein